MALNSRGVHIQKSYYCFFPSEYFAGIFQDEKIQGLEKESRKIEDSKKLREEYYKIIKKQKNPDWYKTEVETARNILKKAKDNAKISVEMRIQHGDSLFSFFSILLAVVSILIGFLGPIDFESSKEFISYIPLIMFMFLCIIMIAKNYISSWHLREQWLELDEVYSRSGICFDVFYSAVEMALSLR